MKNMSHTKNKSLPLAKAEEQQPIQLVYWNIRGMAQPIRHLLEYLHIPYTEVKYDSPNKWFKEDIEEVKKVCLFPSLPYVNDNGFTFSETIAIAKYLCRKSNRPELLGESIEDQAKVDEILSKFVMHRKCLGELTTRKQSDYKISGGEPTPQELKKIQKAQAERLESTYMEIMSGQYVPTLFKLLENKQWVMGYLTVADFFAYETIFYLTGIYPERMADHKHVYHFKERFEAIEEIKDYNNSDRAVLKTFMHPIPDIWKGDPRYY